VPQLTLWSTVWRARGQGATSPRCQDQDARPPALPMGAPGRVSEFVLRDHKLFYIFVGMAISAGLFVGSDVSRAPSSARRSSHGTRRISRPRPTAPSKSPRHTGMYPLHLEPSSLLCQ